MKTSRSMPQKEPSAPHGATPSTPSPIHSKDNRLLGVIFAILGAFSVSLMGLCVKSIGEAIPTSMELFARFLISLILLSPMIYLDRQFTFKVTEVRRLMSRSLFGLAAMGLYFAAVKSIPLTIAILLSNITPALVPIAVFFMLGIRTRVTVWCCIALSLLGIVIVVNPRGNVFHIGSLYAMLSAVMASISILQMRLLTKTHRETTLLFYYFCFCTLASGVWAIFSWQTPSVHVLMSLFWIGLFGSFYQLFFTWAIARAPARIVTPALLSSIVFGAIWDHFFFHTHIMLNEFIGAIILLIGILGVIKFQH